MTTATGTSDDGWDVAIYPVLLWVPLGIGIDVTVPPGNGGEGGSGQIIDGRFDGAFLGGFSVSKGLVRVDASGLWAAVGGDRPDNPKLTVDVDAIYFTATAGIKVYKALYVTGGVRRYALNYDITVANQPTFSSKPGLWDPLVGIGVHHVSKKYEVHATFDGGGFGVGADVDLAGEFRADWKPIPALRTHGRVQVPATSRHPQDFCPGPSPSNRRCTGPSQASASTSNEHFRASAA